jgi:hypothetical protein
MSKPLIQTHAGDDSDGKIWGIEGVNILFILAGLLTSVGLMLMLYQRHTPQVSFGLGIVPVVLAITYVLALRQGKPKSFDTDLLETIASGTGWAPPAQQARNPLHRH